MGESIYTAISIRCPDSWGQDEENPPWFIAKIADDMYDFVDASYWGANGPGAPFLWTLSGQLNYGTASEATRDALEIMRELRIPFEVAEEGGPDWPGSMEFFDGFESFGAITDGSNPVIGYDTWNAIVNQHTDRDVVRCSRIVDQVNQWWADRLKPLSEVSIQHLSPLCPPHPDTGFDFSAYDMTKGTS